MNYKLQTLGCFFLALFKKEIVKKANHIGYDFTSQMPYEQQILTIQ